MDIECYNEYLKFVKTVDEVIEQIDKRHDELKNCLQGEIQHSRNHTFGDMFKESEDTFELFMERYEEWLKDKENQLKHEIYLVEIDGESEQPFLQFSFSEHGEFDSLYSEIAYLLFERDMEDKTDSIKSVILEKCNIVDDITEINDVKHFKEINQVIEERLNKMPLFYERLDEVTHTFSNFFEQEYDFLKKMSDELMVGHFEKLIRKRFTE